MECRDDLSPSLLLALRDAPCDLAQVGSLDDMKKTRKAYKHNGQVCLVLHSSVCGEVLSRRRCMNGNKI